jgi:hypothetical protein
MQHTDPDCCICDEDRSAFRHTVINPIPDYMAAILFEMNRRFKPDWMHFHGDVALLCWNENNVTSAQTRFAAPTPNEMIDESEDGLDFFDGYQWTNYCAEEKSPNGCSLSLSLGVVDTDLNAGMYFWITVTSPLNTFRAGGDVYQQHLMVTSMEEWRFVQHNILDGAIPYTIAQFEEMMRLTRAEE